MLEREDGRMLLTDMGWALESKTPTRKDLFWVPEGTKEVWWYDGDDSGWVRVKPPQQMPCKELNHG